VAKSAKTSLISMTADLIFLSPPLLHEYFTVKNHPGLLLSGLLLLAVFPRSVASLNGLGSC